MRLALLTLALCGFMVPAYSAVSDTTADATMNMVDRDNINNIKERVQAAIRRGSIQIVVDYLLENGLVTEEELAAQQEARQAAREELRALREAGDEDAFRARVAELRAAEAERKAALRDLIESNDDLRQALIDFRQTARSEFRDRIRDRIRDRQQDDAPADS